MTRRHTAAVRKLQLTLCILSLSSEFPSFCAHQTVSLSMTFGNQCFGSRVTLLCTHPDPFADSGRYVQEGIRWAKNGTVIDFSKQGNARFTPTRLNSTASTLSFTVTAEDHRHRVLTFTCFLAVNNDNRDRDKSEPVNIDSPEKPLPPSIALVPTSPPYIVSWTHDKRCYDNCSFVYILTWIKTSTSSDPLSPRRANTAETMYDLSGLPPGEYSVSIQAVCNENRAVASDVVSFQISLPAISTVIMISKSLLLSAAASNSPSEVTTSTATSEKNLIVIIIPTVVTGLGVTAIAVITIVIAAVCGCRKRPEKSSPKAKGPSNSVEYDKIELSDKPVTMTNNPSYEPVQWSDNS